MKKYILILLIVVLQLLSCTNINKRETKSIPEGILRVNETSFHHTCFPYNVNSVVDFHILSQIYSGLVKYEPNNLEIIPDIAKSWKISKDGKQYVFYLNNNVFFHEDKCFDKGRNEITRKVKASDFKYSLELYCLRVKESKRVFLDIVGAKKYCKTKQTGISGIEVVNDTTLVINIKKRNPLFLHFLASIQAVVLPKEAVTAYAENSMIGTGPYFIKEFSSTNKKQTLYKNTKYFKKDKNGEYLPYIDLIEFSFISSTREELELFEQGKVDMVLGLTGDFVNDFLNNNIDKFQSNPPIYILKQTKDVNQENVYNFFRSNVNNLFINRMNYLDLSIVYLKQPKRKGANKK
ncbi:MAG: hypothetical protein KAG95_06795 [Bacteroidales bacterium]|nr:hypothetical protein [Bacteroidales bacterium]